MSKSKHSSDEERLEALENTYITQTTESMIIGKIRGVATMKVICQIADVDTTYAYGKNNPTDKYLQKYKKFQKKVNDYAKSFKLHKANLLNNIDDNQDLLEAAREHLFNLKIENNSLLNKLQIANSRNTNLQTELLEAQLMNNKNHISQSMSQLNDNTINVISPDRTLQHNGQYQFFDIQLRNKAWNDAKEEFQRLMRRKIPQRIYLLVGLPCAGKSTWIDDRKMLKDRHTVIVDATNLMKGDRAQWITLARKNHDVKICTVMFLTDFMTIKERNSQRHSQNKFIDVSVLESKRDKFEPIDIKFEDIDEMVIVREE